jgi:serine/threonine protein phosphatase PrpC
MSQPATEPLAETGPGPASPGEIPFQVERDFAGRQYVGQRDMQEDYYAFCTEVTQPDPAGMRLLVALGDGLGAHVGGNVASYFLVDEFVKACRRSTLSVPWRLRVALETANEKLHEMSSRLAANHAPMGSTFLGVAITRNALHWVSVGDSPLFLFRDGTLTRLNADHSLAPILDQRVRDGELTAEEAAHHPDRHILQSACLGQPLTIVDARMDPFDLKSGDIVISSSDGILTLQFQQLEQMLAFGKNTTAGKIADAIIFAVRCADRPRQDNVTVAVVKIP